MLAIADETTIKSLEKYRDMLGELTDPRKTTEARAQQLLHTAKPIYCAISGMHSPETGGPEMLIELAYRLIVEETPFIQNIRNNVVTLITPVIEVDGREKQVDTYYFNKKRAQGDARLPLIYWGKYVQHDNNRDGMGQFLKLTQAVTKGQLEWHPTVMHDLHEAQTYLYSSTGTGPYNDDARSDRGLRVVDAGAERRDGDDQARRARRVDLRVLRRLGAELHVLHRAQPQRDRPLLRGPELRSRSLRGPSRSDRRPARSGSARTRRCRRSSGARATTPTSSSRRCCSRCSHVAKNKDLYLENYWLKNKRAVDKGKTGPTYAWVIPAAQRRKADAADAVNELRAQGLEISRASSSFKAGSVDVKAGDYIVRGDQPFRTLRRHVASRCRTTRRRIRRRTTTRAGRSSTCATSKILPVTDKSVLDQQNDDADRGCEGDGRD
mgnify:CR=1 FL=1